MATRNMELLQSYLNYVLQIVQPITRMSLGLFLAPFLPPKRMEAKTQRRIVLTNKEPPSTSPSFPAWHRTHVRRLCSGCSPTRRQIRRFEFPCLRNLDNGQDEPSHRSPFRIEFHEDNRPVSPPVAMAALVYRRPAGRDNDGSRRLQCLAGL